MTKRLLSILLLSLCCLAAPGCGSKEPVREGLETIAHRELPQDVHSLTLTADSLNRVYGDSAFVFARRDLLTGKVEIIDDTTAAPDTPLDDARLIVYVEGSGDSLEGFRYTARLIASSPLLWPGGARPTLLLLTVHWSTTRDVVAEHVNLGDQLHGAVVLQDLVQVHNLRHHGDRRTLLSLLGFSAGTRVVQMAFGARIDPDKGTVEAGPHPDTMDSVNHIAFVGSSIGRDDLTPFERIQGRFVNFVNRRDTHFGDRAPNVAPAGSKARLGEVVNPMRIVYRSPGYAASANGFDALPTLTAADQFLAADGTPAGRAAFRRVNVRVPETLVPYNVLGVKVPNDDLDDFVNLARNHYILVGRGGGGTISGPEFAQYRDAAADFVRTFVTPVLVTGRIPSMEFSEETHPINAMDTLMTPIRLPGKLFGPMFKGQPPEEKSPGTK